MTTISVACELVIVIGDTAGYTFEHFIQVMTCNSLSFKSSHHWAEKEEDRNLELKSGHSSRRFKA